MAKQVFVFIFFLITCTSFGQNIVDLSGPWSFRIDREDKGVEGKWFDVKLDDTLVLPGSMTSNGKGDDIAVDTPWTGSLFDSSYFKKAEYAPYRKPGNIKVPFWLQPVKYYKGAAWYQKVIDIPSAWEGQLLELFIERAHMETTVWLDGQKVGVRNALGAPHVYKFRNRWKGGTHVLTVRVDNRIKDVNVGENAHSISDHTQTNWNGMIGRLELRSRPLIHITGVRLFPDVINKRVSVEVILVNLTGKPATAQISCEATSARHTPKSLARNTNLQPDTNKVTISYPMGENVLLWSEFTPHTYAMKVNVIAGKAKDNTTVSFGMRSISISGTQFTMNGAPIFLRGTLESAIFPRTGYPATDVKEWSRVLSVVKSFGLNHVRFHSWCPPEAAFSVADSLGLYLQVESSSWANWGTALGDGAPIDQYIFDESDRIVNAFGNHPSFCFMSYGNEPAGKRHVEYLTKYVKHWKTKDPRRLYTAGAGWPAIKENDYHNHSAPRIQHWEEGLKSIINKSAPSSNYDWSQIIAQWDKPVVSHEIGQWCAFPDFREMTQYDGVLKPKNFEIFRTTLEKNHLLHLADSFLLASGKLQTLCYKADIEAALRTKNFAGFQLLDLHDFPGQGSALVGVLNAFWKEKGYVTASEFRRFTNVVVPLVRFPKFIFKNSERIVVPVEVANFSGAMIGNVTPSWRIKDTSGNVLFSGKWSRRSIPLGNGIYVGDISQDLTGVGLPSQLVVEVRVGDYANSWDIFVYPDLPIRPEDGIIVTELLDARAIDALNNGGKVLLTARRGAIRPSAGGDVAIGFSSIFWNTAWTNGQAPHTLGILCNPNHPAFAEFPTQYHSNWQWWDVMSHSSAIRLDVVDAKLSPIVRVIDDWVTSRSIGVIFECTIGKGKLMVSGVDFVTDIESRPEAKQLLHSLRKYMNSIAFNPSVNVSTAQIQKLFGE